MVIRLSISSSILMGSGPTRTGKLLSPIEQIKRNQRPIEHGNSMSVFSGERTLRRVKTRREEEVTSPLPPFGPVFWRPVQALWIDVKLPLLLVLEAIFNGFFIQNENVLTLVVINEVQVLQSRHNIFFLNACHFANFTKAKI